MEELFCAQCAVWKPKESVTFATVQDAEQHCLDYHAARLLKTYQELQEDRVFRKQTVIFMMRDRNAP